MSLRFKTILISLLIGLAGNSFSGTVTHYEYVSLPPGNLSFSDADIDWLVFSNVSATVAIHAEKSGGSLLSVQASGITDPLADDFTLSWEGGEEPNSSGSEESGLGFSGFGTYIFNVSVAPGESGVFQLFMTNQQEDSCTIQSIWGQDLITDLTASIGSGYFEVTYTNSTQWTDTVRLSMNTSALNEPTFYAMSSQIPEPEVLSLIVMCGGGLLLIRRIFCY